MISANPPVIDARIDAEIASRFPEQSARLANLLGQLEGVQGEGRQWSARCPAHRDSAPSLSVGIADDGKILFHCHSGCETDKILSSLGLMMMDLFPKRQKKDVDAGLHAVALSNGRSRNGQTRDTSPVTSESANTWKERSLRYRRALSTERLQQLARALGLPEWTLREIGVGWRKSADSRESYTFPERDNDGRVIGISTRTLDGHKRSIKGSHRGLILPHDWATKLYSEREIIVVEGATDVAAALATDLFAIGRPSAKGGVALLTQLLDGQVDDDQKIIVLGENDRKPDGSWPGRDGAVKVAEQLATRLRREIQWALPPGGAKDLREWYRQNRSTK